MDNIKIKKVQKAKFCFTLFESHLSYCISVWGGAAPCHLTPIWMSQKHCIIILFGDKESYLNKFKTCTRARPVELQALSSSFYEREHAKPIFKLNNILCMYNLHTYHSFMEDHIWAYAPNMKDFDP